MRHLIIFAVLACGLAAPLDGAQPKEQPKKLPPFIMEALKKPTEDFIKQFDKNTDKALSKGELPPLLAKGFEKADKNNDGVLSSEETAEYLVTLRQLMAAGKLAPPKLGNTAEEIVASFLKAQDKNGDGKIAKAEAINRLADGFDKLDANRDGFLDRKELTAAAQGILSKQPAPKVDFQDFDALDKNADGRLTQKELEGTPWAARFADVDVDRSGQIDRAEFERYQNASKKSDE